MVFDERSGILSASKAYTVYAESTPIWHSTARWNLTAPVVIGFVGPQDVNIKGLIPYGRLAVNWMDGDSARVRVNVGLPPILGASLVGVTADVTFTVDFVSGFHLNSLHLACRHAAVGMLELDGLSLDYEELESTWKGQATAILPFEGDPELTVAVEIQNGDLKSLGVEVGNLNKPIGAVWFLQKLGFEMARDPVTLTGTAGVTALPQVSFAGQDYSVASIDGHITIPLDRRAAFSLSGELHVVDEPLADGSLTYTLSKSVLAGHIDFQDAGFGAEGDLNGWVEPDAASLEGQADVTLEGHAISEGRAVISTVGIAACGSMFGGLLEGGWGLTWDQILPRPFSGCDLSAYAPIGSTHRVPVAAPASQQVTLPGGLTAAAIEISGDLGTPYVTVNGPNGETLVTPTDPGNEGYVGNQFFVVTNPYRDSTDIMIKQPAAGIWTIESQPSSVPIVGISVSKSLPSPVVAAGVSGVGQHRTLHWTLTPHPGQVVQFMEQGSDVDRVIATTSLASGSADFKPAAGLPGVRDIRALVSQDGLPRTTIPLGTYQAPKATSSLSLQAHRTSRSVIASGELKPEHLGSPVTITLRRKFQGQVTLLAKRKVLLGPGTKPGHSVYAATFRRPQGGTCLITTRYGGDAVYAAVSKTLRIAC